MKYLAIFVCLMGMLASCSDVGFDDVDIYYEFRVVELMNGKFLVQKRMNNLKGHKKYIDKKWSKDSVEFYTIEEVCGYMNMLEENYGKNSIMIKRVVDCNKEGE